MLQPRDLQPRRKRHQVHGKDTAVEILVGEQGTVSVLDQGEGIPPVNRERIFERFWRRDRRRPGGAGLGLSIVKRIVDAHGASVAVANRPNSGAELTIRFIADEAPTPREGKAEPESTLATTS